MDVVWASLFYEGKNSHEKNAKGNEIQLWPSGLNFIKTQQFSFGLQFIFITMQALILI
jgi:hypothetical protein